MFPQGVRGNKRRKEDQFKLMKEIRELLPAKRNFEIMKVLRIPNSTFYRYKAKIYNEDIELWSKTVVEPLESRMLKIMGSLEESYRIYRQIAQDEKAKPMDRIRASRKMVDAQYNIMNLLKKGPNSKYYEFI
jgi:hypothetical protein